GPRSSGMDPKVTDITCRHVLGVSPSRLIFPARGTASEGYVHVAARVVAGAEPSRRRTEARTDAVDRRARRRSPDTRLPGGLACPSRLSWSALPTQPIPRGVACAA